VGVLKQNKPAYFQLAGPAPEFPGHFEPFGGRPEGRDFLQFGFEGHADAFGRAGFGGGRMVYALGFAGVVFFFHHASSFADDLGH
jgi:hypothetical protein